MYLFVIQIFRNVTILGKKIVTSIRIDEEVFRKAKDLGLSVSKVAENALKEAIRRLESPSSSESSRTALNGGSLITDSISAKRRIDHKPAKPVVLWAARVQIPHPAPQTQPWRNCNLKSFLENLDDLNVFLIFVLSGCSFIRILDSNLSVAENNIDLAVFQCCRY